MPYCFWRSSVKFQGHTAKKSSILTQIRRFQTVTPVWIHLRLRNDAQSLSSIEEVPYCFLGSSFKFQGHTVWKIDDLNPIWVRLLGRSQLSNPSDLPCFLDIGLIDANTFLLFKLLDVWKVILPYFVPSYVAINVAWADMSPISPERDSLFAANEQEFSTLLAQCEGNHQRQIDNPTKDQWIIDGILPRALSSRRKHSG